MIRTLSHLLRQVAVLVMLSLALSLALVSAPAGAAGAAGAARAVDSPPPPLRVTASGDTAPRYGDDLRITVASTGSEVSASISWKGAEIAAPKPLDGGAAVFTIPSLGRFEPGQTYRFDVEASNEVTSGTTAFSFTPTRIAASIRLSNPSTSFSSPFFGVVSADRPTAVVPTGRVELVRAGVVRATYDVRTDGTFALRDATMAPGDYPGAEIRLVGSAYYADTAPGAGSAVADLSVTKVTTKTALSVPAGRVTQGAPFVVTATPTITDLYTEATLDGLVEIYAAPNTASYPPGLAASAASTWTLVASAAATGGPIPFDLTSWAKANEGNWFFLAKYTGSAHETASQSEVMVAKTRRPGDQPTTMLMQVDGRQVAGRPVKVYFKVAAAYDHGFGGDFVLEVDGVRRAPQPVSAVVELPGLSAGSHTIIAHYLGTPGFAASQGQATFSVARAQTSVTAVVPAGAPVQGGQVAVTVESTDSPLVPAGSVELREGMTVLASAPLAGGSARLTIPRLGPGSHPLQVAYVGDADTEPSAAPDLFTVTGSGPGPSATITEVAKVKRLAKRKVRLSVTVRAPEPVMGPVTGDVVVMRGSKIVARGALSAGRVIVTTKRLPRGRSRLVVRFTGTPGLLASSTQPVVVRLR